MSEPTVKIPVRLALRAARHLYHLGGYMEGTTAATTFRDMSAELQKHVAEQCSMDDLSVAAVAIELQESA